jgi:hypothetical protein
MSITMQELVALEKQAWTVYCQVQGRKCMKRGEFMAFSDKELKAIIQLYTGLLRQAPAEPAAKLMWQRLNKIATDIGIVFNALGIKHKIAREDNLSLYITDNKWTSITIAHRGEWVDSFDWSTDQKRQWQAIVDEIIAAEIN